jgi:enoyl-CoA hydratase/carnithine racemase
VSESEVVTYRRTGRVVELRLNRPEKLNAVNDELINALGDSLYRFDADNDGWIAIISGEGRAFCAGADVASRLGSAPNRAGSRYSKMTVLLSDFENTKPVICAVHGYAYGAGFRLVLHSDLAVADTTAKFQLTEVVRGIDGAHIWAEMNLRGFGTFADDLALTGRVCGAEEAYARGVVNRLAPAGTHLDAARELADQVLGNPPLAIRALVRSRRSRLKILNAETSVVRLERSLNTTNDFKESVAALKEKRKPVYTAS